jgi:hypothetical protein
MSVHQLQRHSVVLVEDPGPVRWEKSGVSWIKCNVDVAFVADSGVTSMSLCFCDTDRQYRQFMDDLTQ